jgi:hypothetical protein
MTEIWKHRLVEVNVVVQMLNRSKWGATRRTFKLIVQLTDKHITLIYTTPIIITETDWLIGYRKVKWLYKTKIGTYNIIRRNFVKRTKCTVIYNNPRNVYGMMILKLEKIWWRSVLLYSQVQSLTSDFIVHYTTLKALYSYFILICKF